jgi:hypothetical protein
VSRIAKDFKFIYNLLQMFHLLLKIEIQGPRTTTTFQLYFHNEVYLQFTTMILTLIGQGKKEIRGVRQIYIYIGYWPQRFFTKDMKFVTNQREKLQIKLASLNGFYSNATFINIT